MNLFDAIDLSLDCSASLLIFLLLTDRIDRSVYWGAVAAWAAVFTVLNVAEGSPVRAAIHAAVAAVCGFLWWINRRKGRMKRAARELGEKSRARVQALVEQMTPSPIPSPVGGAV